MSTDPISAVLFASSGFATVEAEFTYSHDCTRDEEPESDERPREHPSAPDNEEEACDALDLQPCARDLLKQHKPSDRGHPPQVHYAGDEQQTHQQPAAPDAIKTMAQSHLQGSPGPVAPLGQNETQRRAAVPEAGVFKRRKLEDTGAGQ
jgi:hypothetical protein